VLVVTGPDPALHAEFRARICAGEAVVVCDVSRVADCNPATVDGLLRLALTARRCGGQLRLVNAQGRLHDLLTCTGLAGILCTSESLPVEAGRETERGEQ
jgi:anti-anti-sigma regulatory factor